MSYKLPKEYKKKWIEALESDKYDQDEGFLYNDCGYFCALGVAFHAVSEIPLDCLENVATLEDVPYEYNQITYLNDNRSFSFKDIANWIENWVEGI